MKNSKRFKRIELCWGDINNPPDSTKCEQLLDTIHNKYYMNELFSKWYENNNNMYHL